LNRLQTVLKEAEDNGRVYEASEAQEEIDEYNIAAEALKERYPGLYDKLAEVLATIEDPSAEMVTLNTRYENNDPETVAEVRTTVRYCLDGFETSLGEIGIMFVRQLRFRVRPSLGSSS